MNCASIPRRNTWSQKIERLLELTRQCSRANSLSANVASEQQRYKDTVRCGALVAEVPGHRQDKLTRIWTWKHHCFHRSKIWEGRGPPWPPLSFPLVCNVVASWKKMIIFFFLIVCVIVSTFSQSFSCNSAALPSLQVRSQIPFLFCWLFYCEQIQLQPINL